MKTIISAAVAASMLAGASLAHPSKETHICGIDPDTLTEWPGYGTRGNIYDRGDYFFAVGVKDFSPSISYKHWNKVESITTHYRVYKDDCRVSEIEIVHPESDNSRVAGVDYIVFSLSEDFATLTITYKGESLNLELGSGTDAENQDSIDLFNTLNEYSKNGESYTSVNPEDSNETQTYDFSDPDTLFEWIKNGI